MNLRAKLIIYSQLNKDFVLININIAKNTNEIFAYSVKNDYLCIGGLPKTAVIDSRLPPQSVI